MPRPFRAYETTALRLDTELTVQVPRRTKRDAGVRFTLGSDDPPYFGASVAGEYEVCAERFGFTDAELLQVTSTAIDAAFCDEELKASLRRRLAEPVG